MDALAVCEETGLDWVETDPKSEAMHAGGHDLHMAGLLGAAEALSQDRGELKGDVVFVFEPGAEGLCGAKVMLEEGLLEVTDAPIIGAYGVHVFSANIPTGQWTIKPGAVMASGDLVTITVTGKGGHGSAPHLARDPIMAAADLLGSIQTALNRQLNAQDPTVITFGQISGGASENAIAETVTLRGTVRGFSPEIPRTARELLERVAQGVGHAHDVDIAVDYRPFYPVTSNDPKHAALCADVARDIFGPEHFREIDRPLTASEDFSFMLQEIPGAFMIIGATPRRWDDPALGPNNHSAHAEFDESVIPQIARYFTEVARRRLNTEET